MGEMRSAVVTGGFGFIGSHLVEILLGEPDLRVHVVDNLSTSPIDVDAYVRQLPHADRLTWDITTVKEYFAREGLPHFDEVYHLASVVGPVGVLKHSGNILRQMTDDMYAVAEYCIREGARLVDVSTSEVYGGGRDGYCSENDSMIIPPKISARLEYAVGKLGTEVALMNMTKVTDLFATIVRPFNVAGPRQSTMGGFVLPRFIRQALVDENITVYGDGSMVRAFTHVRDISDGIIRALRRGEAGEPYNVGNPANKLTILELARRVVDILGSRSEITFVDPKQLWGPLFEEANDKFPDADRAMGKLAWAPAWGVDEIIRQTADYIRADRRD